MRSGGWPAADPDRLCGRTGPDWRALRHPRPSALLLPQHHAQGTDTPKIRQAEKLRNDDIYCICDIAILSSLKLFNLQISIIYIFKGTQDWEFFWLRFWNLRYFFVSYVKTLRFYQKIFLIRPLLGEVRFFRVVLGLRGMKKNFELGQKFFFFFFSSGP